MGSSMLREATLESPPRSTRPRRSGSGSFQVLSCVAVLVATCLFALSVGRYHVPIDHVIRVVLESAGLPVYLPSNDVEQTVVLDVRMPRIMLGLLVGGGLGIAGAALQAIFRNPLVSPEIIGVSSGASLGGALVLLVGWGSVFLVGGAFVFGLAAMGLLFVLTLGRAGTPMLMVVLGGVVIGSFFSALVSLVTYVADPYTTLPAIVFWLLGSVATATSTKVLVAAIPILVGALVLLLLRWRINVLSLGDEDAASLGVHPSRMRWFILISCALIVAGAVAVSGVIGWVGLVIPHLVRMWSGPDHRVLLPMSFLVGSIYLIVIDTLARTLSASEIPLGVLTAVIGAPVFFFLLRRNRDRIWDGA